MQIHIRDQREAQDLMQDLRGPLTKARAKLAQKTLLTMVVNLIKMQLHDET